MLDRVILDILSSWQVRTIVGLILLDLLLGVGSAVRRGSFDWARVGQFYRTNVIPYLIGYVALVVTIQVIIPPNALSGLGGELTPVLITAAWAVLVSSIVGSVVGSLKELGLLSPAGPK